MWRFAKYTNNDNDNVVWYAYFNELTSNHIIERQANLFGQFSTTSMVSTEEEEKNFKTIIIFENFATNVPNYYYSINEKN